MSSKGKRRERVQSWGMAHGEASPPAGAGMAAHRSHRWGSMDSSQGVVRLAGQGGMKRPWRAGGARGTARLRSGTRTREHDSKENKNEEHRRELTRDEGLAGEEKGSPKKKGSPTSRMKRGRDDAPAAAPTR